MSNNIEKKCSICGKDYAAFYFKNKFTNEIICEDCILELPDIIISTTRHYFIDGEYLGNDDEIDELYESICNYLDYEEVEDE